MYDEMERGRERESLEQFVCIKVFPFGLGDKAVYERETDRQTDSVPCIRYSLPSPTSWDLGAD